MSCKDKRRGLKVKIWDEYGEPITKIRADPEELADKIKKFLRKKFL